MLIELELQYIGLGRVIVLMICFNIFYQAGYGVVGDG